MKEICILGIQNVLLVNMTAFYRMILYQQCMAFHANDPFRFTRIMALASELMKLNADEVLANCSLNELGLSVINEIIDEAISQRPQ